MISCALCLSHCCRFSHRFRPLGPRLTSAVGSRQPASRPQARVVTRWNLSNHKLPPIGNSFESGTSRFNLLALESHVCSCDSRFAKTVWLDTLSRDSRISLVQPIRDFYPPIVETNFQQQRYSILTAPNLHYKSEWKFHKERSFVLGISNLEVMTPTEI